MAARTASEKALIDTRAEANQYVIEERDLRNIRTLDDAFAFVNDNLGGMESFSDYGNGFEILSDKDRLVKTPFAILEWRFSISERFKSEFVSMLVVTEGNEKWIVNDGSTGICKQLRNITDERIASGRPSPQSGLVVKNGLRRSDYETEMEINGKTETVSGTTYYLS